MGCRLYRRSLRPCDYFGVLSMAKKCLAVKYRLIYVQSTVRNHTDVASSICVPFNIAHCLILYCLRPIHGLKRR